MCKKGGEEGLHVTDGDRCVTGRVQDQANRMMMMIAPCVTSVLRSEGMGWTRKWYCEVLRILMRLR